MIHQSRDYGITRIKSRANNKSHGMGLGVILFDDDPPAFPGDVRNPSAFPYPIQYEIAEGVNNETLVFGTNIELCRKSVINAAKKLEKMGCRAIVGECGYFSLFQKDVTPVVNVPVFMSSLLQVPFIQQIIGLHKTVAIAVALKWCFTNEHLTNIGIDPNSNIKIFGIEDEYDCPEFSNLWDHSKRPKVPTADYETAERDFVFACKDFVEKNPDVGALMLECSGFPTFGRAIQREIDLPVFDWSTLMDYAYSVVAHRDFYGHV